LETAAIYWRKADSGHLFTAMPVFQLSAFDQPIWFTHKFNKLIRAFLLACKDEGLEVNA
jgi:hypothetical protein